MIKCQKCGQENPDDSRFCNSCGEKLIQKEKYRCSKCGKEFVGENAYCNGCGTKLVYAKEDEAYAIKISNNNKRTEATQSNPDKLGIIKIAITNGLIILATLLMMISVYLPFVKMVEPGFKTTLGLNYLFRDMWDAISSGYLTNFSKIICITLFTLFIFSSILSLVFGVLTIVKASKGIIRKTDKLPTATLAGVFIPVLIYFVYGLMTSYSKVVYSDALAKATYAAGGVMAIVATSILLLAFIYNKIMKFISKEEFGFVSNSIGLSLVIVSFIIPVACFTSLICVKDGGTTIYFGIQNLIETVSADKNLEITIALSVIAEMLLIITLGLTIVLFTLSVINITTKKMVKPILIISSILFVFSIALAIVSKEAAANILADANGGTVEIYNNIKKYVHIGPSLIALIVLSASMIGASITSLIVKNK